MSSQYREFSDSADLYQDLDDVKKDSDFELKKLISMLILYRHNVLWLIYSLYELYPLCNPHFLTVH